MALHLKLQMQARAAILVSAVRQAANRDGHGPSKLGDSVYISKYKLI